MRVVIFSLLIKKYCLVYSILFEGIFNIKYNYVFKMILRNKLYIVL